MFTPKWQLAIELIETTLKGGFEELPVLADAGFGDVTEFRQRLTELKLRYTVGISRTTSVWPPGEAPLPPKPWSGRGRKPLNLRRTKDHKPLTVLALALAIPPDSWQNVTWREGSDGPTSSRFALLKVRPAHLDTQRKEPWPEQWLLIE